MEQKIVLGNFIDLMKTGNYDCGIHGCNCQGVMGGGIAKAISDEWAEVRDLDRNFYKPYGKSRLGHLGVAKIQGVGFIINAYTQDKFGPKGKKYVSYDAIDSIFETIGTSIQSKGLKFLYPLIGADLGGGHWPVIQEIINHRIGHIDRTLVIWDQDKKAREKFGF